MSAAEAAVDAISALRSRTREVRSIQERTAHLVGAGAGTTQGAAV